MSAIKRALAKSPDWCVVERQTRKSADLKLSPPSAPCFVDLEVRLEEQKNGGLTVRESVVGTMLPKFCPERHINPGGTFCLFLDSTNPILTELELAAWWHGLAQFLQNQCFASSEGYWPITMGLSHGDAADIQLNMERLLTNFPRLQTEAWRGMFRREGWLGWSLPRVSRKGRLYDGTRTCPRGCSGSCQLHSQLPVGFSSVRSGQADVRLTINECKNPKLLAKIVVLESKRRRMEKVLIKQMLSGGTQARRPLGKACCGTMKICPVKQWRNWA